MYKCRKQLYLCSPLRIRPSYKEKVQEVAFSETPFNQPIYYEKGERYIPVNEIIYQLEKFHRHLDTIYVDEDEFLVIQQKVVKQSDVLTGNEVREIVGQGRAVGDSFPSTRTSTRQRERCLDEGVLFHDY